MCRGTWRISVSALRSLKNREGASARGGSPPTVLRSLASAHNGNMTEPGNVDTSQLRSKIEAWRSKSAEELAEMAYDYPPNDRTRPLDVVLERLTYAKMANQVSAALHEHALFAKRLGWATWALVATTFLVALATGALALVECRAEQKATSSQNSSTAKSP